MEHLKFLNALKMHGRDWKKVARTVITRTSTQCRSHAQKFIVSLEKQGKNLENVLEKNDFSLLCHDALNMESSNDNVSENFKNFKFKNQSAVK